MYFSAKLWEHRLRRCRSALLWSVNLIVSYFTLRRQLANIQGWNWVKTQMPKVSAAILVKTTIFTLKTAWGPPIEREAIKRTNRIRLIVMQLESLKITTYPISNRPSQRVYFAAVCRCIEAICKGPISRETLAGLHMVTAAESKGIVDFLLCWLHQKLSNQPHLWSELNINNSSMFSSLSPLGPTSDLGRFAVASSRVRQARREYLHAQVELVSWVSSRQLANSMIESELKILALPTAILEACRRRAPQETKQKL
jgi:hypothetical protein